jgi:GT2 family glycosyltransferase
MDISVVIVNYRSRDKLINCLESLNKTDWSGLSYEIIVVENNSGDKLDDLVSLYKDFKLIISEKNLGMGGGNNLGITQSSGEYILIANPDLIFKEGAIWEMYQYLKNNLEVAIVGPQLLNPDMSLQYSCARFPNIFLPLFRRTAFGRYFPSFTNRYLMKKDDYSQTREVDWLLGACLMVRRDDLFVNNKLFDERFFMYFEDVDLGKRARLNNKKTVYLPTAQVVHDHMRSSARLPWYKAIFFDKLAREHLKSWFRYFKKWYFS